MLNFPYLNNRSHLAALQSLMVGLMLAAPLVRAQSDVKIEGVVEDRSTGKPLYGVNVTVIGTAVGAVTDREGRFALHNLLVGEYTIEARLLGYGSQQLHHVLVGYDQSRQIRFTLPPQIIQMPAVDITATGERWADHAEIVIDRQMIQQTQAGDVAELLAKTCGVEIQDNLGAKSISIRGSQTSQVLILVDGVRLQNGVTGAVDLSTLPLAAIDEVKVYKGAQSSRFGANALAGVVQIITRQARENQISAELRAASFGGLDAAATVMRKSRIGDLFFSFEQNRRRNDYEYAYDLSGREVTERLQNADVLQRQFFGRWTQERLGQRWSFSVQQLLGQRGLPGAVYGWTPQALGKNQRSLAVLVFEKKQNRSLLSLHTFLHHDFASFKNVPQEVELRYRSTPPYWNENVLTAGQFQADFSREMAGGHKIDLGVELGHTRFADQERLYDAATGIDDADLRSVGVHLRDGFEKSLYHQIKLEGHGGLRYDVADTKHSSRRQNQALSPALGLGVRLKWGLNWHLHAEWNRGFRLPTFADLFYQQYRVRGNPSLRPEKSENREWSIDGLWRNGLIRFSRFHQRIEDLIIWRMGGFATFSPINSDALLSGEEYEGGWNFPSLNIETQISYSHLKSVNLSGERTTHGKQLPYRPAHSIKGGMGWRWRNWQVNAGFRRSGERFVTEANTVRLPGFTLFEASLQHGFVLWGRQQTVKLSGYNLTDARYQVLENAPLPGREWRTSWNVVF